jgi:hypothetical protein
VTKTLVTGMSGTGKSTALPMLGRRGHRVVDTDTDTDEWSRWVSLPDGSPDWIWREDALTQLPAGHADGSLFVAGCKTNQGRFYGQFDHIALLSAPIEQVVAQLEALSYLPVPDVAEPGPPERPGLRP